MNAEQILKLFSVVTPMFTALTCFLLMFRDRQECITHSETRLKTVLMWYFAAVSFTWFGVLGYYFAPPVFVVVNSVFYFSELCIQIVFYHFVYVLTSKKEGDRFPLLHYLLPLILGITLFIWSFSIPFNEQLYMVESQLYITSTNKGYSFLSNSKLFVRLFISVIYTALCFYRLIKYHQAIKARSKRLKKLSIRWTVLIMTMSAILLINSIIIVSTPLNKLLNSFSLWITALFLSVQMVIIAYNTLMRNYLLFTAGKKETNKNNIITDLIPNIWKKQERSEAKKPENNATSLTKEAFENYFLKPKLYIDPELTINDLIIPLKTNRSYLSAFINRTYGMNFRQFINSLRLKELDRITKLPENKEKSTAQLVVTVGFGSYRTYLRAKQAQNNAQPQEAINKNNNL